MLAAFVAMLAAFVAMLAAFVVLAQYGLFAVSWHTDLFNVPIDVSVFPNIKFPTIPSVFCRTTFAEIFPLFASA